MSLVTIATFSHAFNMHVMKGRLETEGIPAFAKDEHTISVNPLYGGALGGIKLQVREEDVPEAERILAEAGYVPPVFTTDTAPSQNRAILFLKFMLFFIAMLGVIYLLHEPLKYLEPAQREIVLPLPKLPKG